VTAYLGEVLLDFRRAAQQSIDIDACSGRSGLASEISHQRDETLDRNHLDTVHQRRLCGACSRDGQPAASRGARGLRHHDHAPHPADRAVEPKLSAQRALR
jgi:hypothetical protein